MNSKLPLDTLGRIWDLSDIDKDGFLDRDEFTIVSTVSIKGNVPPLRFNTGYTNRRRSQ